MPGLRLSLRAALSVRVQELPSDLRLVKFIIAGLMVIDGDRLSSLLPPATRCRGRRRPPPGRGSGRRGCRARRRTGESPGRSETPSHSVTLEFHINLRSLNAAMGPCRMFSEASGLDT